MAKNQYVFPPDAGATNAGTVPTRTKAGRGIPRTGDIRHFGDNIPPSQTGVWTPGTVGQNVVTPNYDNDHGPGLAFDRAGDAQAAANAVGTFDGFDGSGEGFDPFSGKQGGQA